jgi:lysyl-tRNA synthetase class 2
MIPALVRNRERLWMRAQMIQAVRRFFIERDYLEVDTQRIPARPEYHIDAVPSGDWFLQTSPELCMKRSWPRAILKSFKSANASAEMKGRYPPPSSPSWNGTGRNRLPNLMEECEDLIHHVGCLAEAIPWLGRHIIRLAPWNGSPCESLYPLRPAHWTSHSTGPF